MSKGEVVGSVCVVCKRQQTVKQLQGERSFDLLYNIRCITGGSRWAALCVWSGWVGEKTDTVRGFICSHCLIASHRRNSRGGGVG